MRYRHLVIYVGRSSVFTDARFTEKLHNTLHTHEEHGWELTSATPRAGPLGDVSGIWLFFKRPEEAGETETLISERLDDELPDAKVRRIA
jgi:hypothetical protein